MTVLTLSEIQRALDYGEVIPLMRVALASHRAGECAMPMPMHLDIPPQNGEVHIKSSYRHGGKYFGLKIASTFPGNLARGLSTGSGMMVLCSAETGQPVALLADEGHLTDVRTAAVAAMVAQDLGRKDTVLGILGTGVQARLQAQMHAQVLPLERIVLWGRTPGRAETCRCDIAAALPGVQVSVASTPAEAAHQTRLIVTATASRAPLLFERDLQPGAHVSAVGSDAPGKQEVDPAILLRARSLWLDSPKQCALLGEYQHIQGQDRSCDRDYSVADFTGLGVEDLFIAEYVYENRKI
jgi:ornithine cyclodeaminase